MTIAEFKDYFPEFTDSTDAQINRALDIALATSSENELGTNYDLGLKYLTAHFLALNSNQFDGVSSGTKSISSKSVDGVSISYGDSGIANDATNGMLNSTSYGQMYVRLTSHIGAGGFTC